MSNSGKPNNQSFDGGNFEKFPKKHKKRERSSFKKSKPWKDERRKK